MELGIAGRRAAVAASSRGLGYAVAAALAAEGVHVAMCSRRREAIEAAAASVGHDAVPIVADVAHVDGATEFVHAAAAALGDIDILVTNAGGPPPGTFATVDVAQYPDAFDLNCLGAIAMCKETVPGMQQRKWGRVLAITSIAVRQPIATLILSNTARAGLTAFLKTLAREVAADGVTVNSLQPGLHATERLKSLHGDGGDPAASIPARTLGEPADFGAFAAFLCSDHARFVTGAAIPVDGGAYAGLL
ncbi:MAG: short-chain dehydrogenase/reductase [Actinomycetia bacterium]|nr:short-chain dehydrogenase/reductase [Actinomycetes bacterium]